MRSFTVFLFTIGFLACSENVQFQEINLAKALEEAKQSNKKVLIDFWADG